MDGLEAISQSGSYVNGRVLKEGVKCWKLAAESEEMLERWTYVYVKKC